ISDEEIHWRMMLPMLNEALRALDEGVVASTEDLSLAARLGLGFPNIEGGLWGYIESIGWDQLQQQMKRYAHLGSLYTYQRSLQG
ncbi:MAG: fatty acid oxidation complex subunit alpha FadB, partial [Oceanospirillaceae bacterium]|nr:fatty acid oxidation complex subunit alpha FadB [Oceanospirillaceae bacterium]